MYIYFEHTVPPQPSNISILKKDYGQDDLNVTLIWNLFADRIDRYFLASSAGHVIRTNGTTNMAKFVNIPYNTNITTEIAAVVCGVQGMSRFYKFDFSKLL